MSLDLKSAIEFVNINKSFGKYKANADISFNVLKNSIHAIVGENGAGKSTLMSILFGIYSPDSGEILVNGEKVFIKDPNMANEKSIGMVHQHFKLVDNFTNLENVILGWEFKKNKLFLNQKIAREKILLLQKKYNLFFDLNEKTGKASVSTQQKIEIMKLLYRDVDILIFDEPTAVLTDEEIEGLLNTFIHFKNQGKTVIFITHKLNEVEKVADFITIIKTGKVVENFKVDKNKKLDLDYISGKIVGKKVTPVINNLKSLSNKNNFLNLVFENVSSKNNKLKNISFTIRSGEIFSFAGVAGNGQEELEDLLSGFDKPKSGKIFFEGKNITNFSVFQKKQIGIAYVPGDRLKKGLILDFTVAENSILRSLEDKKFTKFGFLIKKNIAEFARQIIAKYQVKSVYGEDSEARSLSGGNQQKLIVGREVFQDKKIIICINPVRGLDVGATSKIYRFLLEEKKKGKIVILISFELDEITSLSDKVAILNDGKLVKILEKNEIDRKKIGILMTQKSYEQNN